MAEDHVTLKSGFGGKGEGLGQAGRSGGWQSRARGWGCSRALWRARVMMKAGRLRAGGVRTKAVGPAREQVT